MVVHVGSCYYMAVHVSHRGSHDHMVVHVLMKLIMVVHVVVMVCSAWVFMALHKQSHGGSWWFILDKSTALGSWWFSCCEYFMVVHDSLMFFHIVSYTYTWWFAEQALSYS